MHSLTPSLPVKMFVFLLLIFIFCYCDCLVELTSYGKGIHIGYQTWTCHGWLISLWYLWISFSLTISTIIIGFPNPMEIVTWQKFRRTYGALNTWSVANTYLSLSLIPYEKSAFHQLWMIGMPLVCEVLITAPPKTNSNKTGSKKKKNGNKRI